MQNDQSKNRQPVSVGSTGGSADFVQENHDKLCALSAALKHLVEVIEAHEIESLSCDRDGNEYCDCLRNAATEAKRILPNAEICCTRCRQH